MSQTTAPRWERKRTRETRLVEETIEKAGFPQVNTYRYNSASIRVRVIDPRFEGLSFGKRVDLVEPCLEQLPERTQADIFELFLFTPSELQEAPETLGEFLKNKEFDHPSPSRL